MKFIRAVSFLVFTAFLVACSTGGDRRYLDASLGNSLELPPNLAEIERQSEFELPVGFSATEATGKDKVPVLAKIDSLRLEGSGDLYWLTVEEPVDNLYQLVKKFWLSEGHRLAIDEPVIGIMQTEWVITEQGPSDEGGKSWFASLFSDNSLALSQDQYRTRLERVQDGNTSRIYIAHRATENLYVFEDDGGTAYKKLSADIDESNNSDDNSDNPWRFRQPEPELEVEMLSRLMIFLGLQKTEVESQVASAKLFGPRAYQRVDSSENSPYLIVKDPYQIAWNRVYHELERMNFDIDSADFESGGLSTSEEGFIVINARVSEGKGDQGLFSFFSQSGDTVEKQIVVVLAEVTHELTRVTIETDNREFDTSKAGAAFLDLLYQKIR